MKWSQFGRKLLHSVTSSVVVWTFLFLGLVDFLLVNFRPLQYITDLRFIPLDQHPIVSKIPVYMESKSKVDVLILGSSLPMNAIARYDQKLYGRPNCDDVTQLRRYIEARYLERELSDNFSKPVKVTNLSITACMISDLYIILSKGIEAGKRPDIAVLCIAPRDFVDRLIQPIGRTPPFEILQDWKCVGDVFGGHLTKAEARDLLISAVWYFYRVKVDYRTILTQYFSILLDREASLFHATKAAHESVSSKPGSIVRSREIVESDRYNPPNFERFALEAEFFHKLLALCKKENIKCIVIDMPMAASYSEMLDERLARKYLAEVRQTCKRYDAQYSDFNDSLFVDTDFADGFHVNAVGAEKLMKRLVSLMIQKPLLQGGMNKSLKESEKSAR